MTVQKFLSLLSAVVLLNILAGCSSAPVKMPAEPAPPPQQEPKTSDEVKLKQGLTERELSPQEVADLSDRLLTRGSVVTEKDLARLELILLKALRNPDRLYRAVFCRNLGIIHYNQGKYKQARQELQVANELNPKNGRTHYYLARLSVNEGEIYERQGKKMKARQQFKRAAIEMELARKLEPSNPLYRKTVRELTDKD